METIRLFKTKKSILPFMKSSKTEVLTISEEGIYYNSTLGNIGLITKEQINSIELGKVKNAPAIKILLQDNYQLPANISDFKRKLHGLYKKETGADILFFRQDIDNELSDACELMKKALGK